jgi:hypothetical protein
MFLVSLMLRVKLGAYPYSGTPYSTSSFENIRLIKNLLRTNALAYFKVVSVAK